MKADTSQFPQLDKTKFEQRGKEFEFGIPITNSVCLGNSIAVGFWRWNCKNFSIR